MSRPSIYLNSWGDPPKISEEEMAGNLSGFRRLAERLKGICDAKSIHGYLLTPDGEDVRVHISYLENGNIMIRHWIGDDSGQGTVCILKKDDTNNEQLIEKSVPLGAVRAILKNMLDK